MAYRRTTRTRRKVTRQRNTYKRKYTKYPKRRARAAAPRAQTVRIVLQTDNAPQLVGAGLGQTVSSVRENAPKARAKF